MFPSGSQVDNLRLIKERRCMQRDHIRFKMAKIERLNVRLEKLLSTAVQEVLELVRETVSECQQQTSRTQRENQSLRRRLMELQDKLKLENYGMEPQISPASERGDLEEDTALILSNKDVAVICPTYSFENLDCKASITSLATPCASPRASTLPQSGGDNAIDPKCLKAEPDDALSAQSSNIFNPITAAAVPEGDHTMKVEPTSDEDGDDPPSPRTLNPGPPQVHVTLLSGSGLVLSAEENGLGEPPPPLPPLGRGHSLTAAKRRRGRTSSEAAGSGWRDAGKRYCCSLCGRTFGHAGDYKKHGRVHTGEKPYHCSLCGKTFSQSSYLTVHLRYHTGEKPFRCRHCGKSFSHSSNMKKHEKTHL